MTLSGPDFVPGLAGKFRKDQFDICVAVTQANQTVSDVKHAIDKWFTPSVIIW